MNNMFKLFLALSISLFLLNIAGLNVVSAANTSEQLALDHLNLEMDKYHSNFDVYTDGSAAGNHFVLPARIGTSTEINLNSLVNPHRGSTCIESNFTGKYNDWGGWYMMNGVLTGTNVKPNPNWGTYSNAGFDLRGATKLNFYARGRIGGEKVEFFAFGVGKDEKTGKANESYPDSSPKKSLGYITLTKEWRSYSIDLNNANLSYVIGGFGWVTNAEKNNNKSITFYIDDVKYNKNSLNNPRLIASYELLPGDEPILKNTAYTYDNSVALLSYLIRGNGDDIRRAKLIGNALVYAIDHDRNFTDGRLRNAYQAGDLILFPGWKPNGKSNTIRIPGWWDSKGDTWNEDKFCVGTQTGNVAWSMIALISLYEKTKNNTYLNAAIKLGDWINTECKDTRGAGGYTGGYEGWEETLSNPQGQTKILWKSTEHNIDVYVAFIRLYKITGVQKWRDRALIAKKFVETMWNADDDHFWTGTNDDGTSINKAVVPLDVNTWSIMALGKKYSNCIKWVENNCYVQKDGFYGFDFNTDKDGVWFEGTAQMIVAYEIIGNQTKANFYLEQLKKAQNAAKNTNGMGLVAASHDGVTTGFEWQYNSRLHIGATSWLIFGKLDYNPYWNIKTSITIPTDSTPPTVSSSDPANGATKVARNKVIKVSFNENIKSGSNYSRITLKSSTGKTISINKSISGKVLTIKHNTLLSAKTKYTLTLYSGSVKDMAGNPLAAKTITFTTGST